MPREIASSAFKLTTHALKGISFGCQPSRLALSNIGNDSMNFSKESSSISPLTYSLD